MNLLDAEVQTMPRECSICSHPESAAVSKALAAGGSKRTVAARFGLAQASVQRHRQGCLRMVKREKPAETSAKREAPRTSEDSARFGANSSISTPKDLLDRLQSLFRLGDLLEEAYVRRDVDACVKLSRELRSAAESYAKVAGWMTEGSQTNISIDFRKQSIALAASLEASGISDDVIRKIAWSEGVIDAEFRAETSGTAQNDVPALPSGESK
jgi:hypothetical protein